MFQKNLKIILGIVHVVYMTKAGKIYGFENTYTQIHTLLFLCSPEYKVFGIDILRLWDTLLATSGYFFNFFKIKKI